jgi:hypothetical protein
MDKAGLWSCNLSAALPWVDSPGCTASSIVPWLVAVPCKSSYTTPELLEQQPMPKKACQALKLGEVGAVIDAASAWFSDVKSDCRSQRVVEFLKASPISVLCAATE